LVGETDQFVVSGRTMPAPAAPVDPAPVDPAPGGSCTGRHPVYRRAADTQFAAEIARLADLGITTGFPDGTFRPVQPINRDAMAAFLFRLAGQPEFTAAPAASTNVTPSGPFTDVTPGNQFFREISWLRTTGVTTGFTDGSFHPYEPVNRDAMAAFLTRYIDAGLGTPGTPAV
jgi:beta-glucosidase